MDMLVKLYDLPDAREILAALLLLEYQFAELCLLKNTRFFDWVRGNFSQAWASEADVAFGRQPVSCFVAVQAKRLLGFACHDATCPNFLVQPVSIRTPEGKESGPPCSWPASKT
jgi:hypothetical protein